MPGTIPHLPLLRAIRDAYAQAFCDIPGVTIDEVFGRDVVMVRGTGRSPTLHMITLDWEHRMGDLVRRLDAPDQAMREHVMETVEAALDGDAGATATLAALDLLGPDPDMVDIQAGRLAAARAMGIEHPVRLPPRAALAADPGLCDAMPIAQVSVDSLTPLQVEALIIAERGVLPSAATVRRTLVTHLAHAHEGVVRDGHVVWTVPADPISFEVTITDRLLQSDRRLLVHLELPGHDETRFDGELLVLQRTLPDTVLAAAIGKPLGKVVATGTPLDTRRILDADCHRNVHRTDLVLERDGVSLATL